MKLLPQNTHLGKLGILEVYDYYDMPCLFSCKNLADHIFLAILSDLTKDLATWLYVPVSRRRFENIRSSIIDLHDAFVNSEDGFVYQIVINDNDDTESIKTICCEDINPDLLPFSGEFIDFSKEPLPFIEQKDVLQTARQIQREVLHLAFNFPTKSRIEAPIGKLGAILESLQRVFDAIGQAVDGHPTPTGRIPEAIKKRTQLMVIGTYLGSFGVELAPSPQNLEGLDDDLTKLTINKFIDLLDHSRSVESNPEIVRNQLFTLKSRVASGYTQFLENLIESRTNLYFSQGSPKEEKKTLIELSLKSAKKTLVVIKSPEDEIVKEYKILGILIGFNIRKRSYEIVDNRTGKSYSGRILDEALLKVQTVTSNNLYMATIREVKEKSPIIPEGKLKYKLVDLQSVNDSE